MLDLKKKRNLNCFMYALSLAIPDLPKSLNKTLRSHYFKNNAQNKKWDFLIKQKCVCVLPEKPLKKAHISIVRHFYRTLDYDGLVGSMKPVVDALISCGVIENDNWNTLGEWSVTQEFRSKSLGPLLEIKIVEIKGEAE